MQHGEVAHRHGATRVTLLEGKHRAAVRCAAKRAHAIEPATALDQRTHWPFPINPRVLEGLEGDKIPIEPGVVFIEIIEISVITPIGPHHPVAITVARIDQAGLWEATAGER